MRLLWVGVLLLFAGLFLSSTNIQLSVINYLQPKYTSDAIILYDGAVPTLTWDSASEIYEARLYYKVNFKPDSNLTKYYFLAETTGVSANLMWALWFYNESTGGLGSGVGAWFIAGNPNSYKYAGVEIPGYYTIPWTWYRNGTYAMIVDFHAHSQVSGNVKIYIKWQAPPKPQYTVAVSKVKCEGLNRQIIVQGTVSPAVGGKQVKVTVTYPSGQTKTRFLTTSADGTFNYTDSDLTATEAGVYTVQAFIDNVASEPVTFQIVKEEQQTGNEQPSGIRLSDYWYLPTFAGACLIAYDLLTKKKR